MAKCITNRLMWIVQEAVTISAAVTFHSNIRAVKMCLHSFCSVQQKGQKVKWLLCMNRLDNVSENRDFNYIWHFEPLTTSSPLQESDTMPGTIKEAPSYTQMEIKL